MNKKEEISVQSCFNTANELHQGVTEMELQCTITPDLFQCDHPSRGQHIASCTQSFSTAKRNMPLGMLSIVRDVREGGDPPR
ncbi:hypothetical protein AVEN_61351-1 [Araneus ventricosus]|uniref:Uncharacterized protein n=1 Tax=Araneus ventricosus TaxID=182803 RepID=A0A4Y2X634_ARAVE|nr:hypothetical protein AVEN_61351-1 [Araneus ventricosus]